MPVSDKDRIDAIETFDEFEEFTLKCGHYVIVAAARGVKGESMMCNALPFVRIPRNIPESPDTGENHITETIFNR